MTNMIPGKGAWGYEKKYPVVEVGLLAYELKLAGQGEVAKHGAATGFALKNANQLKVTFERQCMQDADKLKWAISPKIKRVKYEEVIKAIKERSYRKFVSAVLGFETTLKGKPGWKLLGGELVVEGGVEFALLPIILKGTLEFKDTLMTRKYSVTINVGPSKYGWGKITERVGIEVVKNFLRSGGRVLYSTLNALMANGFFLGAAIGGATAIFSFGLLAFTALYAKHVGDRAEIRGLSTWYANAYIHTLYQRDDALNGLRQQYIRLHKQLRDDLIAAGCQDAVQDARRFLADNNITPDNPSDDVEALIRFANALKPKYKVEETLHNALIERAKQMLGS